MEQSGDPSLLFSNMELDHRILKAIAKLSWHTPTLIQEKAIPLLLEGKDVLIRARTGSGKTAAYLVPLVQNILKKKQEALYQDIKALVMAPSRELCTQICNVLKDLTVKCSREIKYVDISANVDLSVQESILRDKPDVVVGTPSRILQHLKAKSIDIKNSLEILVIDEADLIFSFGYKEELKEIATFLPTICQAVLASATLSEDVKTMKNLVLHNPVVLKLEEPEIAPLSQLTHYLLEAEIMEKATILYSLLKLHLIRGKTIIFVNTVDKCYQIKLYLEQFGIATCVLNSELPASIRCHSVNQFNQGVYDVIVASDERNLDEPVTVKKGKTKEKHSRRKKDKESGLSRGIDFQLVSNVINFDFPLDVDSYIHRAGRTARGNNEGNILSLVSMKERALLTAVEDHFKAQLGDATIFKPYQFKLEEVESFKYRAQDAWRAVTRIAVREARLKEIKMEIYNSSKLKAYFQDNPTDLEVLRHDKALHTVKIQRHLTDVPEYIVPETLKALTKITKRKRRNVTRLNAIAKSRLQAKKSNPLKCMKFEGFKKKKSK